MPLAAVLKLLMPSRAAAMPLIATDGDVDADATPVREAAPRLRLRRPALRSQRHLLLLLAVSLAVLAVGSVVVVRRTDRVAHQLAATGQSLMQSQRLAKSASQALLGRPAAFAEVRESADSLARAVRGLSAGDAALSLQPVAASADTRG